MHFKNIVALVVREYVAHQLHIPVTEVTMDNLNTFLQDNDIPTIVQCIFDAIFGSQGSIKAKNTVDYWLRYTDSMTKVFILFLNYLFIFILYSIIKCFFLDTFS